MRSRAGLPVLLDQHLSPHYHYPTDKGWKHGGTVEKIMHEIDMFGRGGALDLDGFKGSGADWLERYKPWIEDGKTVVTTRSMGPRTTISPCNCASVASTRFRAISRARRSGPVALPAARTPQSQW